MFLFLFFNYEMALYKFLQVRDDGNFDKSEAGDKGMPL